MRTHLINKAIGNLLNAMKRVEGMPRLTLRDALARLHQAKQYERRGEPANANHCLGRAYDLIASTRS